MARGRAHNTLTVTVGWLGTICPSARVQLTHGARYAHRAERQFVSPMTHHMECIAVFEPV